MGNTMANVRHNINVLVYISQLISVFLYSNCVEWETQALLFLFISPSGSSNVLGSMGPPPPPARELFKEDGQPDKIRSIPANIVTCLHYKSEPAGRAL